jgi:hypothetical protein
VRVYFTRIVLDSDNAGAGRNISARVLTQLLKQKTSENRQLQKTQHLLATQHASERARTEMIERRALELAKTLRKTLDDLDDERRKADTARAELALYKAQLDAQQRIVRDAQRTIDELVADRDRVEAEAARSRTTARQLKEQIQVRDAYDEAYKEGIRSGLRQRDAIDSEDRERRTAEAEERASEREREREVRERRREEREKQRAQELEKEREKEAEREKAARDNEEQEKARREAVGALQPVQAQMSAPMQQELWVPRSDQPHPQRRVRDEVIDSQSARPHELRVKTNLAPRQMRVQRGLEDVLFSEVSEVAETPPGVSAVSSFVNIPSPRAPQYVLFVQYVHYFAQLSIRGTKGGPSMPEPIQVFHPPMPTLTTPFRTPQHSPPSSSSHSDSLRSQSVHPESARHDSSRQYRRRHTESVPAPPPKGIYRAPDPHPAPAHHPSGAHPAPPSPYIYTPHPRPPSASRNEPQVPEPQRSRSVSGRGRASPGAALRMPDGWIPHAQDLQGDGRFSINLPPPHELTETARSEDQYELVSSPEEGGQSVIIPSATPRSSSPLPPPPTIYSSQPARPPTAPRPSSTAPPPVVHNVPRPPSAPMPPPPVIYDRDRAHRQRHLVPPQQHTIYAPVNASRTSTLISDYEMLHAPPQRPPAVDEYSDTPARAIPPVSLRPPSRQSQPPSRQSRPPTQTYLVRPVTIIQLADRTSFFLTSVRLHEDPHVRAK